jgi:hypothetical protein
LDIVFYRLIILGDMFNHPPYTPPYKCVVDFK